MDDDLLRDWMLANNAAVDALRWLADLADAGDTDAARALAAAGCAAARWLEPHAEHAAGLREWPIAVPADRDQRAAVLKDAAGLKIGATRGGGKGSGVRGAPDREGGQKAFALEILNKVQFVRAVIRGCGGWEAILRRNLEYPVRCDKLDYGCWEEVDSETRDILSAELGLTSFNLTNLPAQVASLPDYTPATREDWIAVCVAVLLANPHLIPPEIEQRRETVSRFIEGGKTRAVVEGRGFGAVLKRALEEGLATVSTLPP